MSLASPYLTVAEASIYLRFPTVNAFRCWAYRHQIPTCHRGRVLLFDRRDLDAAVEPVERKVAALRQRKAS